MFNSTRAGCNARFYLLIKHLLTRPSNASSPEPKTKERPKRRIPRPDYARYTNAGIMSRYNRLQESFEAHQTWFQEELDRNKLAVQQVRRKFTDLEERLKSETQNPFEDCNSISEATLYLNKAFKDAIEQFQRDLDGFQDYLDSMGLEKRSLKRRKYLKSSR